MVRSVPIEAGYSFPFHRISFSFCAARGAVRVATRSIHRRQSPSPLDISMAIDSFPIQTPECDAIIGLVATDQVHRLLSLVDR